MDSLESLAFSSFIIFSDDPWSLLVSFCQLFKLPLVVQCCDVICERPLNILEFCHFSSVCKECYLLCVAGGAEWYVALVGIYPTLAPPDHPLPLCEHPLHQLHLLDPGREHHQQPCAVAGEAHSRGAVKHQNKIPTATSHSISPSI